MAAGVTVDLVRALTGSARARDRGRASALALTPIAWAIATHAEAHALHLALVAILLWLLVAWDARVRAAVAARRPPRCPTPTGGDRYLSPRRVVFGLAVGNHSLTLLLAIPVGLYVLAVDPGIWRRGRLVLSCVGAARGDRRRSSTSSCRCAPGRSGRRSSTARPNTWDGFRYIVLAEQFQGSLYDPFGELPRKFGELVDADGRPVRDPRAAHPGRASS